MRGLSEIKAANRNPRAYRATEEFHGGVQSTHANEMPPVGQAAVPLPPFDIFWKKLSAEAGHDVSYDHAREAFTGGPVPEGALTFIGKKWEGVRAIPASSGSYYGEFRIEIEDGSRMWLAVRALARWEDTRVRYPTPEVALGCAHVALQAYYSRGSYYRRVHPSAAEPVQGGRNS